MYNYNNTNIIIIMLMPVRNPSILSTPSIWYSIPMHQSTLAFSCCLRVTSSRRSRIQYNPAVFYNTWPLLRTSNILVPVFTRPLRGLSKCIYELRVSNYRDLLQSAARSQ